ncbi:MAG: CPBP family intramembrane glutamic endopeptidase [Thermodesulfobacteriota bacterium]
MLFYVKNNFIATLALTALFALAFLLTVKLFYLPPPLLPLDKFLATATIGLAAIILSDALLHGALYALFKQRYISYYRELVYYFDAQQPRHIIASGLLAGGEELVFRGIILGGLLHSGLFNTPVSVIISSILFSLCHLIPNRKLAPFAIWAVWESVLLCAIYVTSGSLAATVAAHALHDTLGFSAFKYQRKSGFWL